MKITYRHQGGPLDGREVTVSNFPEGGIGKERTCVVGVRGGGSMRGRYRIDRDGDGFVAVHVPSPEDVYPQKQEALPAPKEEPSAVPAMKSATNPDVFVTPEGIRFKRVEGTQAFVQLSAHEDESAPIKISESPTPNEKTD